MALGGELKDKVIAQVKGLKRKARVEGMLGLEGQQREQMGVRDTHRLKSPKRRKGSKDRESDGKHLGKTDFKTGKI